MAEVVVELDDEHVAAIDAVVAAGIATSRADAVRHGLELLIAEYRSGTADASWPDGASRAMIAAEPW